MSTVVLISHNVPDKKLEKETIYKYHPSREMAAKIISDLAENAKVDIHDGIFVDFDFNISVKEYNLTHKPTDKNKCYQESLNTKTDT